MNFNFSTDDHYALHRATTDKLIAVVQNPKVQERLTVLRDAIWPEVKTTSDPKALHREFRKALKGLSSEEKTLLLEAYARMGHIYEITALAARAHYFSKLEKQSIRIPGGIKKFVDAEQDAKSAVARLNQPVFETVMTMHPTNTNSLPFMRAQRKLGIALEAGDETAVENAIKEFEAAPILHQKNGADANFTVRDETEVVLNYLGNIYEDLSNVYAHFDKALSNRYSDKYVPADLKLNMRFDSWGSSGDKDGNDNVTAETTLEAIAMHTQAIVSRYRTDLEKISSPLLDSFKQDFKTIDETLTNTLLPAMGELREHPNDERFDALSAQLAELRKKIDLKMFQDALMTVYQDSASAPDEKKSALDLLRKVRIFGLNFAKIEYRETAKEYSRVVEELVEGYKELSPEARVNELTQLLQTNKPQELLAAAKDRIISKGVGKPYSDDDALPIAYHTLKRMELARDFPEMITDNVLAECGQLPNYKGPLLNGVTPEKVKAQGLANILEAQFVQRMVEEKNDKSLLLGIVPLFEEPRTMENIDHIMRGAYKNQAYQKHLERLQAVSGDTERTQQVQIAHSDNARRSGLLAARAFIHEAHKKMRELNRELGIKTQFFEGGSLSDAYRNGVRAVSASINAFQLQDFTKFTFQGGDLVNYFSLPSSTERLFTRNIPHSAERFHWDSDSNSWIMYDRSKTDITGDPEKVLKREKRMSNPVIDDIAIAALKATLKDYEKEDFTPDTMGLLLAALDYDGETKAGQRGSRAGKRNGDGIAFKRVADTTTGSLIRVDIEKARTIPFSEAFQHAGIVPSWIGSQKLAEHLRDEVVAKILTPIKSGEGVCKNVFLENFGKTTLDSVLSPAQLNEMYNRSPAFRDAQDRAAFALAMTDPESLKWLGKRLESQANGWKEKAKSYLERIKETYSRAGKLAYAALNGESVPQPLDRAKLAASPSLRHMTDDITNKTHYRDFLLYAKIHGVRKHEATPLDDHQRGIVHNAGDTVVHGRFLTADDPTYGESREADRKRQENPGLGA